LSESNGFGLLSVIINFVTAYHFSISFRKLFGLLIWESTNLTFRSIDISDLLRRFDRFFAILSIFCETLFFFCDSTQL
jgi:hypothetical protein